MPSRTVTWPAGVAVASDAAGVAVPFGIAARTDATTIWPRGSTWMLVGVPATSRNAADTTALRTVSISVRRFSVPSSTRIVLA